MIGQYFTENEMLRTVVKSLIKNSPSLVLEPSCGKGHLLFKEYKYDCYEIDETLEIDSGDNNLKLCDFLAEPISKKYETIVGNPPYFRTKNGNLYIDFINKCVDLLDANGELVFIVPSSFYKLTSSKNVMTKMLNTGSFTDIYRFDNEKLFKNASINIIVFRYQLNYMSNIILFNNSDMKCFSFYNGLISFKSSENSSENSSEQSSENLPKNKISDFFDVYVGQVSGMEDVFRTDIGNREFLTDKNTTRKYIYIDKFPSDQEIIDNHLLQNKDRLMNRKIRKFNESNWFEWGAKRNVKVVEENKGAPCIYVRNLTRNSEVAFKGTVMPFCSSLLIMIPKTDFQLNLDEVVDKLNQARDQFLYSGRYIIGHKELSNMFDVV